MLCLLIEQVEDFKRCHPSLQCRAVQALTSVAADLINNPSTDKKIKVAHTHIHNVLMYCLLIMQYNYLCMCKHVVKTFSCTARSIPCVKRVIIGDDFIHTISVLFVFLSLIDAD